MALILSKEDGNHFHPPLFAQAAECEADYHQIKSLPHPFAIATHSWAQIQKSLKVVLDTFDAASAEPSGASERPAFDSLLDAYKVFVYANSEFSEAIIEKIPACFCASGQKIAKAQGAQTLRRHADLVCNKLKHNQNRLIAVEAFGALARVLGYSVYSFDRKGALCPNPEIHSDRRAFSFATDIRLILANTYFLASAVGEIITMNRNGVRSPPAKFEKSQALQDLLMRVSALPTTGFDWEAKKFMPHFGFDESVLEIKARGGEFTRLPGQNRVAVRFEGDGITREFRLV